MEKRPTINGLGVKERAVDLRLPAFVAWAGQEDNVREDVLKAIDYMDEPYYVARRLEDMGWGGINEELLELIDSLQNDMYNVHVKAVREWVRAEGLTPAFAAGDRLRFQDRRPCPPRDVWGEITLVVPEEATYLVFCPELGHVRDGTGTHGRYVNYEDVLEGEVKRGEEGA